MKLPAASIQSTLLLFIFFNSYAQIPEDIYLNEDSFSRKKIDLKAEFGKNKFFTTEIELECLTALSFYPELKNTCIRLKFGYPASTMVSRPKLISVFYNKAEREYLIIIKTPGLSNNGFNWQELRFNALVGWIGHELAHLLHYSKKTNAGVLLTGIKYVFPAFRKRLERFTDQLAIKHNLGEALYEGTDYSINRSNASTNYRNYLKKYYLSPDEIKYFIRSKNEYWVNFKKTRFIKWEDIAALK